MNNKHRLSLWQASWLTGFVLWQGLQFSIAQNYTVDWHTFGGGGGASTGGVFAVSGTIGQVNAGHASGGDYSVNSGFWSIVTAVQTPGAPLLSISHSNRTVIVAWPQPAAGWLLDETVSINPQTIQWTQVAPPYNTNATHVFVTVPTPIGHKFYRLRKP